MQIARKLHHARIIASVAATIISLACGTNYVYSAWAPQFAERLKLSSTESNLIGLFGNLGMYTMGVPIGMFIDNRGPRPTVLAGAVLLALGYFPLHLAYLSGSGSVLAMCFCSYLSGLGGCMAFAASVKTSALNWPQHRGTATAFPLAAFGLSAFFFSSIGAIFGSDPSEFLVMLAAGTSSMTFVGFFFLKVYPQHTHSDSIDYHAIDPSASESSQHRGFMSANDSGRSGLRQTPAEPGTSPRASQDSTSVEDAEAEATIAFPGVVIQPEGPSHGHHDEPVVDEASSLMSDPTDNEHQRSRAHSVDLDRSLHVDKKGLALLRDPDFWRLFAIMGILAGVGLMTINNIGNNAKALWEYYDDSVTEEFLITRQQVHVSILSVGSFFGRLASGVGSDFLVVKYHASRVWCLVAACLVFLLAQVFAMSIVDPRLLSIVSALSGLGYGFLFGVFPSIVAETFGIRSLSQNWGLMTLSPVLSSNVFNIFYGLTYDHHAIKKPNGERMCMAGLECYLEAYYVTFVACVIGLCVTLWTIYHQHVAHKIAHRKADVQD